MKKKKNDKDNENVCQEGSFLQKKKKKKMKRLEDTFILQVNFQYILKVIFITIKKNDWYYGHIVPVS